MEGQEGAASLQQSHQQSSAQQQLNHQQQQHQPYYNSYNSTDYQYPIGHHWMTPGLNSQQNHVMPDHNYNANMMGPLHNGNNNTNHISNGHTVHHPHHPSQLSQHHQSQYSPVNPNPTCPNNNNIAPFQNLPPCYHSNSSHHSHNNGNPNLGQLPVPTSQSNGNQMMVNAMNQNSTSRTPWPAALESVYPGGLEVLWREVPEECQKMMTLQDVPDSAKFRGYFTVCELIALKRNLVGRLKCDPKLEGELQLVPQHPPTESIEGLVATSTCSNSSGNNEEQGSMQGQKTEEKSEFSSEDNTDGTIKPTTTNDAPPEEPTSTSTPTSVGNTCVLPGPSSSTTTVGVSTCSPASTIGPPPPYRTATLVFKLLQIGNYQFRSFSEINPNRLRVLFNTQRLTYECQLPLVRAPREGMQPLRKLLTVDIGFDQITVIRFGNDKLFLRVEGAPLLTVTYNPANDDHTCPPLSAQDHYLLEQIDKGQLKLSPCHQLYFLNERLVHLLEAQFREHPRFRHILQQNNITY